MTHYSKFFVWRWQTAVWLVVAMFGLLFVGTGTAVAQEPIAPIYTQNFDSLANSGTNNTWTNDSTLLGWFSNRTIYNAGTGSGNTGALYSFGSTGSSERALGSVASGTTGTIYHGVRLTNNTSDPITSIVASYTGEQWRTANNTTLHTLSFHYRIDETVTDLTSGTWTAVTELDFTGPVAASTAQSLDGNLPDNQELLFHQITGLNIPAGHEIMLRWEDPDDPGTDHGLAIDDLAVSLPGIFNLTSNDVPEWLEPGWQFWSRASTSPGQSLCIEVNPVGDEDNYIRTQCEYNQSEGPLGSNWQCDVFTDGVPTAFQNVAVRYQFFIADTDTSCQNNTDGFTGFNWQFETGPTAVSLANIGVNTAVPTGLLLILLVVVGTAVCLLTMRRYQNN